MLSLIFQSSKFYLSFKTLKSKKEIYKEYIMALSNSTRTHILDPTVFNSSRAEFRLDNNLYITNLVLANVGVSCAGVDGKQTGLYYNSVNGVLACIRKLSLFSGSTLIDEIQELQAYGSIQHLKTSNQGSEDLNRFDLLNGCNASISGADGNLTTMPTNKDYTASYDIQADVGQVLRHNDQIQVTKDSDRGSTGLLVVANYLQFLQSVQVLPGIENLRLVIEWNNDINDWYVDGAAPANPGNPVVVVMRPQLVFTEILNMKVQDTVKLPFTSNFVERFQVPAVAEGSSKFQSFRSGAFRQRYVQNLTLFNQANANDGWFLKPSRSVAQIGEVIQLIWNGRKYLPDQGCNTPAMKLRYFNDTMGSLNVPLASAMAGLVDVVDSKYNLFDYKAAKLTHNFSVGAFAINDTCDRLDIEITRVGGANTDQKDPYTLIVFGQVSRLLTIYKGVVTLSY